MIEEQMQKPKVSEVDRAYRQHAPDANPWLSRAIIAGFIVAMVALSYMPEYSVLPEAVRAALHTLPDASTQSN